MTDPSEPSGGLSWADLVAWLVERHGSLAAVAERLAADRAYREDVGSIERALRRLRTRKQHDGGVCGRRVLAVFGLPGEVEDRVRWMGVYHSRYTDLPRRLAVELLDPWDRAPVTGSSSRAWLRLARASLALRVRDTNAAQDQLTQAALAAPAAGPSAVVEHRLAASFLLSRTDPAAASALLDEAQAALAHVDPDRFAEDVACWQARLVDQRAWPLNVSRTNRDPAAAYALYQALPAEGAPPFAACRRANGLAWSAWNLGRSDEAIAWAEASVRHAGDAGSLRLRGMGLNALARFLGDTPAGAEARQRAAAIAARLEDEELAARVTRVGSPIRADVSTTRPGRVGA